MVLKREGFKGAGGNPNAGYSEEESAGYNVRVI